MCCYDCYMLYQVWWEIYEILLGVVVLVVGVGVNIVNVVIFGSVLDNIIYGWINYGLVGVNLFMNVEFNGCVEQNFVSIDEKQCDKCLEYFSLFWVECLVLVSFGKEFNELFIDCYGVLCFNLFDSFFVEQDISCILQIYFLVSDLQDGICVDVSFCVSCSLCGKFLEVYVLIYDDLEGDDVYYWVYWVKCFVELGLEEEVSELEQSLIEFMCNDFELQQQFMYVLFWDVGCLVVDFGEMF